jgi:hypothetical protein
MPQIGTELVKAACQRFPALPSRTLARKLLHANKGVWPTLDACRLSILYRRRRHTPTPRGRPIRCAAPAPSTAPRRPWNPEKFLPKSDEAPFVPHVVEVARDTRALILGDLHLPYHNLAALTAALEHGRRADCRLVVLNGDTLDFHRLSRFQKDPRARSAKNEIAAANQLLDALDDLFPKARKIWKDGNHDERYDHYLMASAGEVYELLQGKASLDVHLELHERGWEYVSEKRPIHLGQLPLIHGHEYPTPVLGPVNAARGLFLRTKDCAMVSHHHQTSEHTETTIRGKMITTWSIGCLCDLHPMYARFNKWNHGFAGVELARGGDFQVHNHRIHAGKILN